MKFNFFNFEKLKELKISYKTSGRLLKLVWRIDKKLFLGSMVAIIIPGIIPFFNIYIYKLVIDQVVKVVAGGTFEPSSFYPLIGARVITYFLQDAAFRTQSLFERLLWTKVPIELNQIVLKKISSLDIHYFENDKFRDLLEKVKESYEYRPQRVVDNLFFSLQSLIELVIAFIAIVRLNWIFSIVIVLVSIPGFIDQVNRSKLAYGIWDADSSLKKRFHYLTHLLQHHREIKELKIFQLSDKFLSELEKLQRTFYEHNKGLATHSYAAGLGFNALQTLVYIGIELFVIFQALSKKVTVGDIGFYTGMVNNFQNGLSGLLRNLNEAYESSLYVKTIFDVLDSEPIVKFNSNQTLVDHKKAPIIEFRDISFSYPESNKKIFDNFSLTINPGEKIAFVGENGSGKSTMIKLLARFYDVDKGELLINGVNIKDVDLSSWHKTLGVLFQDFNRYEDSVKENIHFGNIDEKFEIDQIIEAAQSAGAHPMIDEFEKKYEQMLGRMFEGGLELSGGQWQKVALSRAFFRNSPVLVLDEPTAAIDAKAEAEIFERVEKLSKDKTVIIISHRFSTVRNADKIYVISKGRIVESGNHQELLNLDGKYAKLFKLQAKGYQ